MGKIVLEGMDFFAYHGFYEEERKIGNKYTIDLEITTDFSIAAENDELSGTVNYEVLYEIVKKMMETPTKLLEHIGKNIIKEIQKEVENYSAIEVKISKHNPPLGGICKRSTIIINDRD